MRIKTFLSIILVILFGASVLPLSAVTIVDDFNRASLGINWAADPEYVIASNTVLDNSATVESWDYLAIYKGLTSPSEVQFKWAAGGSALGVNSGGIAMYLTTNSPSTADGYFIMRRNGKIYLDPIVDGVVVRTATIASVNSTKATTVAGDIIKVVATTDVNGHHFAVYVNDQLDGTVSDPAKTTGNSSFYYSGVSLFGGQVNNIDDFTVRAQQITVTSPAGGETWIVGSIHDITWDVSEFTGNVKIEYSTNNGTAWTTIVASVTNTGTYSWTVPSASSTNCLVRVSDAVDGMPWGTSATVFEITADAGTITVTSPNGGETWAATSVQNITWTSTGTIANVAIFYSVDNGTNWTSIVASTPNDGSYSWTLPSGSTAQALVKVQDTDTVPSDVSNTVFSITTSQVTLSIQSASGEQAETVVLNVSLTNQVPIRGLQFRLTDTPNHLSLAPAGPVAINRASTFTVNVEELAAGYINIVMVNTTSFTSIAAGSGAILQIPLVVENTATYGTSSSVTFSEVRMSNEASQAIIPTLVNGNFYYVLSGDINGSGVTDQADVDRIVDIILGLGAVPTDYERMAADMDKDGDIDMFDALRVIDELP
ncbi:MAG TPA: dockerin type I domain-containing protein [bacterium]|nr:dockerin type I domain-containing protein [bacterium]HPN42645.1 dockerin type I domain-containing protein [bacterium]